MLIALPRIVFLLVVMVQMSTVSTYTIDTDVAFVNEELPKLANEEYIRHIHSMIDEYRANEISDQFIMEKKSLFDTNYRIWKRNGDLINSLLALPKGMIDAGR